MYWATVSALILPMMRANRPSVCLVPEDAAIVIQRFDVVEIMQVVDASLREVVGMHHAAQPGEGVELVAEVIHALRGAVAEIRRRVGSGSAHLAAFPPRQTAHLDRIPPTGFLINIKGVDPTERHRGSLVHRFTCSDFFA